MLKKIRPTVIGFVILFAFNFYGLHVAQDGVNAAKKAASQAKVAAAQAKINAAANKALTVVVNKNACEATNQSRQAAHQVSARFAASQVLQTQKLQARFEQAAKLSPPTSPQAKASQEAGQKFFDQLVQDTKDVTDSAVADLKRETPIVKCVIPRVQSK